jgi:uncharacterized protein (DUF302 family)
MSLGFSKTVTGSFEEVVERTRAALKDVGFGIVSEIDVKKTFKEKLDVDYRDYLILGACNPVLAKKALDELPEVGLLLPCNVTVESVEDGIKVTAVDPMIMLGPVGDQGAIGEVARDAQPRLMKAIEAL